MAQSSVSPSDESVSTSNGGRTAVDGGTINCRMMLSLADEWRLLEEICVNWLETHNGKQTPPPARLQNWLTFWWSFSRSMSSMALPASLRSRPSS
eukprot:4652354-Amphidinium_carterae.3